VVIIAVGGDGNTRPESMLLLLIIIKWCGPEGTGERGWLVSGAANLEELAELCRWPMGRIERDSVRREGM
jgi:hypothetical protein